VVGFYCIAMKLSVIIPTRNRSTLLEKTLQSLLTQTLSNEHFEVIVVDNGSTDNTFDVVDSFRARLNNIRYFLEYQPGLHVGRHKGLSEALSDILVYADDDIEPFPTWLEGIYSSFGRDDVVLVGGKNLPKYEMLPPQWIRNMWETPCEAGRYLPYLSIVDLGDEQKEINPYYVFGCNFSIRKEVLVAAGGFHPDGMPQEMIRYRGDGETHVCQFINSNKLKCWYSPAASVYHLVPPMRMTIEYFSQRAFNQGVSDSFTRIRLQGGTSESDVLKCSCFDWFFLKYGSMTFNCMNSRYLLDMVLYSSYRDGYNEHNRLARTDTKILEWTLKDTWLP